MSSALLQSSEYNDDEYSRQRENLEFAGAMTMKTSQLWPKGKPIRFHIQFYFP